MVYDVIHDLIPEDIIELRKVLGWKEIGYDQLKKGLEHTMFKISIKHNGKIVACGRIVGDYSCKGLLSDIMVHQDYQKQGLGKAIVTTLLDMVEDSLDKGELFQIEATPTVGNKDFYVKCGMKYKPENQDGVYVWLKK